ncbi:unnamed protein product [Fusarium graminearum]|nr:unnamed protein product [Fusarium graminearum]
MKTAILITALFSVAIAAPAPLPASDAAQDLDTRASCPGTQSCVGGYCTIYTCVPAGTLPMLLDWTGRDNNVIVAPIGFKSSDSWQ